MEQYSNLDEMTLDEAIERLKTFEERLKYKKERDVYKQENLMLTQQEGNGQHFGNRGCRTMQKISPVSRLWPRQDQLPI
ncbi:hypothetical protein OSB04_002134 [Centaurea solstitialis]|uniref:Zinc finger, CCHC-type n=1 Tax=Centaurea solstitialis TaxID=347529 RepID=A0AA38UAY1_9ASTR|nr:hypothetical protein OSB04_002134 [Centaurea solstitialis]